MSEFNQKGRVYNAVRSSATGFICHILNLPMSVLFRYLFVRILSVRYQGLNGLFTNVFEVLALSDMGISSVIIYHCYKPVSDGDHRKVGQLMYFFRRVYRFIAAFIFAGGLVLTPFLRYIIKDMSEVPADVNIYLVYFLFLAHTASGYLYSYKLTMLTIDQRQYEKTVFSTVLNAVKLSIQLLILYLTKNYTISLAANMSIVLVSNLVFCGIIDRSYRSVFSVREKIPKEECRIIFREVRTTMCHKLGTTVLNSTDNIVISGFLGITVAGVFSSYSMIFISMRQMIEQMLGSFSGSIGNANVRMAAKEKYRVFRRLEFVNLWVSGVVSICLFMLINEFIDLWIGEGYAFARATVVALCAQFFMESARAIISAFGIACGLYMRDWIRPLIESTLNIIISIVLVRLIGIAGVFVGTIISHLCTVFWREPYLLFKHVFHEKSTLYWCMYAAFSAATALVGFLLYRVKDSLALTFNTLPLILLEGMICFAAVNLAFVLLFGWTKEFRFYVRFLLRKVRGGAEK